MIKILPRYFIKEHIGPFFFALSIINSVFILNLVIQQLSKFLSKGISFPVIIEFLFLNTAWMLALSVPMAVLVGTIMAFGRLSSENEITAMRASGISLSKIFTSVLLVSGALAIGLVWFNNNVLPNFNHRARLLALDIARKKPMLNLESGVLYSDIPNISILVQEIAELNSISYVKKVLIDDDSEPKVTKNITAEKGELFLDDSGLLHIALFDGQLHEIDVSNPESFKRIQFEKHVIKISMIESLLRRRARGSRGDREKSAQALMETVNKNIEKIVEKKEKIRKMMQKQIDKFSKPQHTQKLRTVIQEHERLKRQIQSEVNSIQHYKKINKKFIVEVHKKYSIPAACVVFILIGAPLGVLVKKQGWAVGAALSIGFFIIYWAFLVGGEKLADREIISPFWAMWGANIFIGAFGVYLVTRTVRETNFF